MVATLAARLYELPDTPGRIRAMEGMRGVAIALVFLVHFDKQFLDYAPPDRFHAAVLALFRVIGHSGVDLFFLLSGYLIYGLVLESWKGYARFLRRRLVRIYPVFLFVFTLYIGLSWIFPQRSKIPDGWAPAAFYLLENLAMLPGLVDIPPMITVAWSLSFELAFYLAMPVLASLAGMRRRPGRQRVLIVLAVSALLAAIYFAGHGRHLRMLMFASGILLWEALRVPAGTRLARWNSSAAAVFVLGLFLLSLVKTPRLVWLPWVGWYPEAYQVLIMGVTFFWFSAACFAGGGWLVRLMSRDALRWLGNMSYSYYLLHGLALQALRMALDVVLGPRPFPAPLFWLWFPLSFLLTVAAVTPLFVLVEKRYSLARAVRRPLNAPPAAV